MDQRSQEKLGGSPRPRLFWVTPRWPLPVEDGARQATWHLVRGLVEQGSEIHLLSIVQPGEAREGRGAASEELRAAFGVARATVVTRCRTRPLKNLLSRPWVPVTFNAYLDPGLSREIERARGEWDASSVVVFDGLHAAGWWMRLPEGRRAGIPAVLRAHNVEADLWSQGAGRSRFPKSLALRMQAGLVRNFEREVCRRSRLVAAVSGKDALALGGPGSAQRVMVAPIGFPLGRREAASFPVARRLLFVGRLDWAPNRDGLKWFLEEVWPKAVQESPDLSLTIAGAGNGDWLQPYLPQHGLRFVGRVPETGPLYEEAIASLVPIFFGSGTRVKAIESGARARACISTSVGVEGIGYDPERSYFRAETREDWLRALKELSVEEARSRGDAAFEWISSEYGPARIASRFESELRRSLG